MAEVELDRRQLLEIAGLVDEDLAIAQSYVRRAGAFVDDLKAQGVHVGIGMPGECVVCEVPWPCPITESERPR